MSVHLRLATAADDEAGFELHRACWQEAYADLLPASVIDATFADREAVLARRRAHRDAGRTTWLAEDESGLVGFASAGEARNEDPPRPVELYALYARATVWGRGVGHALLEAALGDVPAYLWVLGGNDRATRFYARHGFAADGVVEDSPHATHVRMVR